MIQSLPQLLQLLWCHPFHLKEELLSELHQQIDGGQQRSQRQTSQRCTGKGSEVTVTSYIRETSNSKPDTSVRGSCAGTGAWARQGVSNPGDVQHSAGATLGLQRSLRVGSGLNMRLDYVAYRVTTFSRIHWNLGSIFPLIALRSPPSLQFTCQCWLHLPWPWRNGPEEIINAVALKSKQRVGLLSTGDQGETPA